MIEKLYKINFTLKADEKLIEYTRLGVIEWEYFNKKFTIFFDKLTPYCSEEFTGLLINMSTEIEGNVESHNDEHMLLYL